MISRRAFLRTSAAVGGVGLAHVPRMDAAAQQSAEEVAVIEPYWREVRAAFALDPAVVNLDTAGGSPSPQSVHEAFKQHLDASNRNPSQYRARMEPRAADVRLALAQELGCDARRVTLTSQDDPVRLALHGIDLKSGDEIITTDEASPALSEWDRRARREGIALKRVQLAASSTASELVQRVMSAITPRTRVLHVSHVGYSTGQLFPVRDVSRAAQSRGITTIVDGSQAVAHVAVGLTDMECDTYAARLDTWMMAPHGTGFIYVRRAGVAFGEAAVQPLAAQLAIAEAVTFNRAVGSERKSARLRYLTMRWINGLRSRPQVRILSSLEAGETVGIGAFVVDGLSPAAVVNALREQHGVLVGVVEAGQVVRVSPNVYTSVEEIDRFVACVRALL
jgi:isopenicillin-N epimerase